MPRQIYQQLRPGAQPVHGTEDLLTATHHQRVYVRGGWTQARYQELWLSNLNQGDSKQGLEERHKSTRRQLQKI